MTTVTPFSRESVRNLSKDIQDALDAVAKKHGIVIKVQTGRFNAEMYRASFEATLNQQDKGILAQADRLYYEKAASSFGIDLAKFPFGHVFSHGRKRYQVSGLNPNAKSMPLLATEVGTSRTYKFPVYALTGELPALMEVPV